MDSLRAYLYQSMKALMRSEKTMEFDFPASQTEVITDNNNNLTNDETEEEGRRLLLQEGSYWSGSNWHCKYCKFSYDRFGMLEHIRIKHNHQQENDGRQF